MSRRLSVTVETFELAVDFVISRGSRRQAVVVVAAIAGETGTGRGECVPYARYGESVEGVVATIESVRTGIEAGASRAELQHLLPAGAARNALDCALWDLEAKTGGGRVADRICATAPVAIETAYTISLGTPSGMAEAARAAAGRGLLKIKLGGGAEDVLRIRAVAAAARGARLILDANEAWTPDSIRGNLLVAAAVGAILVEQPLPAADDAILATIPHPVPICADESMHQTKDLARLVGRYDYVNVKLDKTGGLTEALGLVEEARRLGFGVMVGCMVSSSLAMAPAVLLGQSADLVDLDGPLLMTQDRENGLVYAAATVAPPSPILWG